MKIVGVTVGDIRERTLVSQRTLGTTDHSPFIIQKTFEN
jgi:hypothetical protein